jgi:MATE family multidrug resistance protein
MAVFALIFVCLNTYLPGLYVRDHEVVAFASKLLFIVAIFQIFDGSQAVGVGMLRGMTDLTIPTFLTFTAYWVIGIPVGYLLGLVMKYGVTGVWWGLFLGLASSAGLMLIRFLWITTSLIKKAPVRSN